MAKLNEDSIYNSGNKPKSQIYNQTWNKRLSSLFGYQAVNQDKAKNEFEKSFGLRFVKVDLGNDAYRIKQAALGNIFKETSLSTPLQNYLERWMELQSLSYADIQERQTRLNELRFMVCNDPIVSASCTLVAQEATQLSDQNRLITVESPSIAFTNKCYELFARWGLTQQRIYSVCFDLQQYGEALWAHKISDKGVEKIIPLKVSQLLERLEFSPVHVAEYIAQMEGNFKANQNRKSKLENLLDMLKNTENNEIGDLNENFADLFDTKLLGFEFEDGNVVPPWLITHFRYNADNSEFFPYGYPPLLMCLAPFKQSHSTIALQGLARSMSFPVQVYSVKGTEGLTPYQAFDITNQVREEFDNIGVSPMSNSLEVYTINSKIWIPGDIVDMKIQESKSDIDFTGDLELYQDRMFIATKVPKGYLNEEFGGFGQSGIALIEQYKPFGDHVYTIQNAFLEGLGQLIRLHFAISGEFSYDQQFVLSMKFPAEEMGSEKRDARTASIDLAKGIIELLQSVLGIEEGEPLPEDVVSDILSKYTFLDETALLRWIRLSNIQKAATKSNEGTEGDEDTGGGGGDIDFGTEEGMEEAGDLAGGDEGGGGGEEMPESSKNEREYYLKTKQLLQEEIKTKKLKRLREISERYESCKEDIYFQFLKEQGIREWKDQVKGHSVLIPRITENNPMWESFQVLSNKNNDGKTKLNENVSLKESVKQMMKESGDELRIDEILSQPIKENLADYVPNVSAENEELNNL